VIFKLPKRFMSNLRDATSRLHISFPQLSLYDGQFMTGWLLRTRLVSISRLLVVLRLPRGNGRINFVAPNH
jgi:hypothetical protein